MTSSQKLFKIFTEEVNPAARELALKAIANRRIKMCSGMWTDKNQDVGCVLFTTAAAVRGKSSREPDVWYWVSVTLATRNRRMRFLREYLGLSNYLINKVVKLWDGMTDKKRSEFRQMIREHLRSQRLMKSLDKKFSHVIEAPGIEANRP